MVELAETELEFEFGRQIQLKCFLYLLSIDFPPSFAHLFAFDLPPLNLCSSSFARTTDTALLYLVKMKPVGPDA